MAFFNTFHTDEAKTAKVFPSLDEIQLTAKLFSCLTFVVYGIAIMCMYNHVIITWNASLFLVVTVNPLFGLGNGFLSL